MKKLLTTLAALCALASTTFAQQVDQPLTVEVDLDLRLDSAAIPGISPAGFVLAWPGSGGAVDYEYTSAGTFYEDVTVAMPVDQEFTVSIGPDEVDEFEVLLTPPPGYEVYIEGNYTPHYEESYPMHGSVFKVQIRRLGRRAGLAVGATKRPEIGRRIRWEIGLGYLANGSAAGRLNFAVDALEEVFERDNLQVEWGPDGEMETYEDANELQRLRSDILVDITNLTGGYRIDFYPAGEFEASATLSNASALDMGDAFRRIEVQEGTGTTVELRVYSMSGGTPTLLVEHTIAYDSSEDSQWTLESGNGITVGRTEVYDYGSGQNSADIVIKKGTVEARKVHKTFTTVGAQKDVSSVEEDDAVHDYTTSYTYDSGTSWLQSEQTPNGSWSYYTRDVHGRTKKSYQPYLDSSSTPSADSSGVVHDISYGESPAATSNSAYYMLDAFNNTCGEKGVMSLSLRLTRGRPQAI